MLLSIDSYGISTTRRSNNSSLDVSFWGCTCSEASVNQEHHQPSRRSYPKWVGVGFHLFLGEASSGRETIHSPPSVNGGAEGDILEFATNKLEDAAQPQGPIFEQALCVV